MNFTSRIPKFYNYSQEERRKLVATLKDLSSEDISFLKGEKIPDEIFEVLIENVIGHIQLPLGIATNFKVNGKDYLIPMVVEESSVVAAASHAAKIARKNGGFSAEYSGSIMIGQMQILGITDFEQTKNHIIEHKKELLDIANSTNAILVKLGGGAKDIEIRQIKGELTDYFVIHLIVDTKDAMGANAVNTMLEELKSRIKSLIGGEILLKILSNYAIKRKAKAKAVFDKEMLGGEEIIDKILLANDFARNDTFRAVTHNKGIMNGITPIMLATGNDTRAIEAGAHAYAAKDGKYKSLTNFEKDEEGNLVGYLEIPLSVGTVGGAINVHPIYKTALKILDIKSAAELAKIVVSVGLAQNVAALRALVDEGIQQGHMELHARNMAVTVGAKGLEIEEVAEKLISAKKITFDQAKKILAKIRQNKN